MTLEEEKQHFVNEILQYGKTMKMTGFNQAMESVHGIEKYETATYSKTKDYMAQKEAFAKQEQMRVEYAIGRLVEIGLKEREK